MDGIRDVFEKLNFNGEKFRKWIEENTIFSYCEDLSGDCFVYYDSKFYVVTFGEFVEIKEISKDDFIEHVKNHSNGKEVIKLIKNR